MRYNKPIGFVTLNNQAIPDEGPKAILLILDFSSGEPIDVDLTLIEQQARMSMVQTLFIDCSQSANDINVTEQITGHTLIAKTKTQGYYNMLIQNPTRLRFTSLNGGTDNVTVFLINVPIPGVVWPVS